MAAVVLLFLAARCAPASAAVPIASRGAARARILVQPGATPAERHAADELARFLTRITGARFSILTARGPVPDAAIIVGPGNAAAEVFPRAPLARMGPDELVMQTRSGRLLLAGGRPRGTLYAVYRFLREICGCRWWTPWAATIPRRPELTIPQLSVREKPAFAWRDVYSRPALDRDWAARNGLNGAGSRGTPETGGSLRYKGFAHTFYQLVPPERYFRAHPEWFALVGGRRRNAGAQLCLTDPGLRKFVAARVLDWLREDPAAGIVSVSQNDNSGACECDRCRKLNDEQGSPSGSLLDFVNAVAAEVEPRYPHVLIDTLAYRCTRRPPRSLRPRRNVVVRVSSIECNFREPFEHPSNAAFARDVRGWAAIAPHLHAWDYTADFGCYALPHPNWFVLGDNLRFLAGNYAAGVFEQGASDTFGGEMAEMRSWVLAQLLWNPWQDTASLVEEFVRGYYGRAAAPFILRYLRLMTDASRGQYLTCSEPPDGAPWLQFQVLSRAEALWRDAERASAGKPVYLSRVRRAHQPVRFAFLLGWRPLQRQAAAAHSAWPPPLSREQAAHQWLAGVTASDADAGPGLAEVSEHGLSPGKWIERWLAAPEPGSKAAPVERSGPSAPHLPALLAAAAAAVAVGILVSARSKRGSAARRRAGLACALVGLLCLGGGLLFYATARGALTARPAAITAGLAGGASAAGVVLLVLFSRRPLASALWALLCAALPALWCRPYLLARFHGARADLRTASLAGEDLSRAVLDGSDLTGADLRRARLNGAWLGFARLEAADLRGADLRGAVLNETVFWGADLRGADLSTASITDTTHTNFAGAVYDASTRWPPGVDPEHRGALR